MGPLEPLAELVILSPVLFGQEIPRTIRDSLIRCEAVRSLIIFKHRSNYPVFFHITASGFLHHFFYQPFRWQEYLQGGRQGGILRFQRRLGDMGL